MSMIDKKFITRDCSVFYKHGLPMVKIRWKPSNDEIGIFTPERAERIQRAMNADSYPTDISREVAFDILIAHETAEQVAEMSALALQKGKHPGRELMGVPAVGARSIRSYDETTTKKDALPIVRRIREHKATWINADGTEWSPEKKGATVLSKKEVKKIQKRLDKAERKAEKAVETIHGRRALNARGTWQGHQCAGGWFNDRDIVSDGFTSFIVKPVTAQGG